MATPLFVNEVSLPIEMPDEDVYASILSTLRGLRRARELAGSVDLGASVRLSEVQVAPDYRTLGSLTKVMDYEWWRFLRSIDQYAPFSSVPRTEAPVDHSTQQVSPMAALWAERNDAFVLSFVSGERWAGEMFMVEMCSCKLGDHVGAKCVEVRNISSPEHADRWARELGNYGIRRAVSTEVYRGPNFSLRIYLSDHPPAHVHVFVPSEPRRCAAKVRFDVGAEYLECEGLRGRLRSEVLDFVAAKREQLLRSWSQCEVGERPNAVT